MNSKKGKNRVKYLTTGLEEEKLKTVDNFVMLKNLSVFLKI
jgi:hypothetical protein